MKWCWLTFIYLSFRGKKNLNPQQCRDAHGFLMVVGFRLVCVPIAQLKTSMRSISECIMIVTSRRMFNERLPNTVLLGLWWYRNGWYAVLQASRDCMIRSAISERFASTLLGTCWSHNVFKKPMFSKSYQSLNGQPLCASHVRVGRTFSFLVQIHLIIFWHYTRIVFPFHREWLNSVHHLCQDFEFQFTKDLVELEVALCDFDSWTLSRASHNAGLFLKKVSFRKGLTHFSHFQAS